MMKKLIRVAEQVKVFESRPNYFACLPISSTMPLGEWASLLKYGTRGRLYKVTAGHVYA